MPLKTLAVVGNSRSPLRTVELVTLLLVQIIFISVVLVFFIVNKSVFCAQRVDRTTQREQC